MTIVCTSLLFLTLYDWRLSSTYIVLSLIDYGIKFLFIKSQKRFFYWLNILVVVLFWFVARDVVFSTLSTLSFLGISFYLFRSIGLLNELDGSRNSLRSLEYFSYMFYLPAFLSGPYLGFQEFNNEKKPKKRVLAQTYFLLFVQGLIKKFVFSSLLFDLISENRSEGYKNGLFNLFFFSVTSVIYITADLSAYTDIARSLSYLFFGIELPDNFNRSLLSGDLITFWRRHHITMSEWYRRHVFFPTQIRLMRMNLPPKISVGLSTIGVFLLSGLWHQPNRFGLAFGLIQLLGVGGTFIIKHSIWRRAVMYLTLMASLPLILPLEILGSAGPWNFFYPGEMSFPLVGFILLLLYVFYDYFMKKIESLIFFKSPVLYGILLGFYLILIYILYPARFEFLYSKF